MATLYQLYEWVQKKGPARSGDRFRMRMLPHNIKEGIVFDKIDASTTASAAYMKVAHDIAADLVGKRYAA